MRPAFLCQDLLPVFFGVAWGGCSLSDWRPRCLWRPRCFRRNSQQLLPFLPFLPFPSRAPYYTFFIPRLLSPVRRFPLADSRSSPYCPGKIAPPQSETAPKTRPCVDFAPFCLLYSIIFCNMNLLSARVVTARTVPAVLRNRMFSEESVLWPLGVVIIVACDGKYFAVVSIVLGCDAASAAGFFLSPIFRNGAIVV